MKITKLYIDRVVEKTPVVESIRSGLNAPAEIVDGPRAVYDAVSESEDPVRMGKQVLFLTENKGGFFRKCPGTSHYICCGYMILHIGTFCHMDCSYCILQSYFHPPVMQFFVNHEKLLSELGPVFAENRIYRFGTGEFTDSLIWESLNGGLTKSLVAKFSEQSSCVLELKTKTVAVGALKGLSHNRKIIVAWSLNTEKNIRSQERGTAMLEKRLDAAARCESWGYPLAFHFDPLILYDGCEKDYIGVLDLLFSKVSPANIAWISIGAFRYMPDLKPIVEKRFSNSKIVYHEFIRGLDGKCRYFKPLRIGLYRKMAARIREMAPETAVYFCMEDDEVWQKTLGFVPDERGGLPRMLDESAAGVCGLDRRALRT